MMAEVESPRVWITSFWGFDPENEGYLGFTAEGNRRWFVENWREGDLILIYGANASITEPEKRHQTLGFLEVEPTLIEDTERLSPKGRQRKIDHDWEGRWTHAVPVIRAAQITRRISIDHIAPKTLTANRARIIASRGELLTPDEAELALSLPVRPINVFGMPPLPEGVLQQTFTPSKGINPTFGERTSNYEDGKHFLYALRFEGDAGRLLDRKPFELKGRSIFKVGYSNNPDRRCAEHNSCLPPAAKAFWKLTFKSRTFASGDAAKKAEDGLKADLERRGESLGGEFFLCDPQELSSAFATATMSTAAFKLKI